MVESTMGIRADLVRAVVALAAPAIASGQARRVEIVDQILQMPAYSMTVPANWIFEGRVMQGTSCAPEPFPVFRLISPDGITEMKMLPRFDWAWSTPVIAANPAGADCLPLDRELSTSEFLRHMVGILGVTLVREVEPAQLLVRYRINSIPVEEYLHAVVTCREDPRPSGPDDKPNGKAVHFHSCSAVVWRSRTRAGQLDTLRSNMVAISQSLTIDRQWNERRAHGPPSPTRMGADASRAFEARHDSLVQGQAVQRRQREQFLAVPQHGTAPTGADARPSGDWANYALDLYKRLDPGTGQIASNPATHPYTWVSALGQRYQTDDLNDIPNGRLKGDWILQPAGR